MELDLKFTWAEQVFALLVMVSPLALVFGCWVFFTFWTFKVKPKYIHLLKEFQTWCELQQDKIFLGILISAFSFCSACMSLDEAVFGLLIFCWGAYWSYIFLLIFPEGYFYLFLLLLAFKISLGTLNYPFLFAVCVVLVLKHFLTKSDLVNPVTTFMKDLQEYQDTENFHKKVEFFYWSFLERFNFLFFFFLALFKDETFVLEYEFLYPLKMYACFFLLVTSCINLIILYVFNPPKV